MLQQPEQLSQVMSLFDVSTPQMQRGLCAALVERVGNAESILAALGIETRGEAASLTVDDDKTLVKQVHVQIGQSDAWLVCASRVHPCT